MGMQTSLSGTSTDPKSAYCRISRDNCVCNGYCSFCTYHCCVFCIILGLTIYASWEVWVISTVVIYIFDGEWYTSSCTIDDVFYDDCCVDNDAVNIAGLDCDDVETVYIVSWLFDIC